MTNKAIYILGGFNIDLLKCETSHFSHTFLLHLQSCYLIPTVDKPTRFHRASATLIDNIFANNPVKILASGNIVTDVSDHFLQVCVIKSAIDKFKGNTIKLRDYSKFSAVRFNYDLSNVHWDDIVSSGKNIVDMLFSSFYNKFNTIVNKHAPMIKLSSRKRKVLSKPWITTGLMVSVRMNSKNKLYPSGDEVRYKYYRNKISSLIRISKKIYYSDYFEANMSNIKKSGQVLINYCFAIRKISRLLLQLRTQTIRIN